MEERRITGRALLVVFWILLIAALLVIPTYYQLQREKELRDKQTTDDPARPTGG